MTSIAQLYRSRCNGDGKPLFWIPRPVRNMPHSLFADSRRPCTEANDVVKRCIGAALVLEIPVGEFVSAQKVMPSADAVLRKLLMSNVSDEARHLKAFEYADEEYGSTAMPAEVLSAWEAAAQSGHPIAVAAALELGVFLCTLGVLRLVGGPSLSSLAVRVAEDEFRHVATNTAICDALGIDLMDYWDLVYFTLETIVGCDVDIPLAGGVRLNLQWIVAQARQLLEQREARELDSLTRIAVHRLPFEVGNEELYDREPEFTR